MSSEKTYLTGQSEEHVTWVDSAFQLHLLAVTPFRKLCEKAVASGFEIQVVSAFRDFGRQQSIWDAKATGKRILLDDTGVPLPFEKLNEKEIVFSILRWSALPGASRHHWGTDFDAYPANLLPPGGKAELLPQEIERNAPFAEYHRWLNENLPLEGFYRPYLEDLGGVNPEWWHLSYQPVADGYLTELTPAHLHQTISQSSIALKEVVLKHFEEIYERFVLRINTLDNSGL